MMEVGTRLGIYLQDIFNNNTRRHRNGSHDWIDNRLSLDTGKLYNHYLTIDFSKDVVEYPVMVKSQAEILGSLKCNYLEEIDRNLEPSIVAEKLVVPLYTNTQDVNKRTFDSTVKAFFKETDLQDRLRRITVGEKNKSVFYGGKGLILDRDFNILLLCTLTAHLSFEKEYNNIKNRYFWIYDRPICYISPKVIWESKDNIMYRGIINKIIPYYSNIKMHLPYSESRFIFTDRSAREAYDNAKVVIDNIEGWIKKVEIPNPEICQDDALNECLADNIQDIEYLLTY